MSIFMSTLLLSFSRIAKACVYASLPILATSINAQTPGSLDTSFASSNGIIPALTIGTLDDRARAMALQPDSIVSVAGQCAADSVRVYRRARLNN